MTALNPSNIQIQKTGVDAYVHVPGLLPASDLERSKDRKNQANAMRRFAGNSFM